MDEKTKDLIDRHKISIGGILNKYTIKKFLSSGYFWFCVAIAVLLTVVLIYSEGNSDHLFELIGDLSAIVLAAFPSLLGFSLAGYALIIGTINIGVLQRMSEPQESMEKMSYFQFVSSVFALAVLVQCITVIFAFIIHVILKLNLEMVFCVSSLWVNAPVYAILLFLILESLVLLCNTVINIFTYSQTVHFCLRSEIEMQAECDKGIWDEIKACIYKLVNKMVNSHE